MTDDRILLSLGWTFAGGDFHWRHYSIRNTHRRRNPIILLDPKGEIIGIYSHITDARLAAERDFQLTQEAQDAT